MLHLERFHHDGRSGALPPCAKALGTTAALQGRTLSGRTPLLRTPMSEPTAPFRNDLKGRTGLARLRNALRYSLDGYRAAWKDEQAFRQIVCLCGPGLILAGLLCRTWAEGILLILPLIFAVVVELCNSAIENVVDRISPDWHPLAKKAKDMGSAAQLTAQLLIALVWGSYLLVRICA